jgi:hypothetical protein
MITPSHQAASLSTGHGLHLEEADRAALTIQRLDGKDLAEGQVNSL